MSSSEQSELIKMKQDIIEYLKQNNEFQRAQMEQRTQTIANLKETINYLKQKLFGTSSEKRTTSQIEGQYSLFNEAEAVFDPNAQEPILEDVAQGHKSTVRKSKTIREEILKNLPIVEIECDLADDDKKYPYCNTDMVVLGKEIVREELRIIPAKIERIRYEVSAL